MAWRHYEVRQSDDCQVEDEDGISSLRFTMGIVETGKQRVFSGHFVCLILTDHDPITGEDEHSLRAALWKLARNIEPLGIRLNCVGLSAAFSESGLSMNTGWGYWGQHSKPMHMMDPIPSADGRDDPIDDMIREAVDGMRIGLSIKLEVDPPQPVRGVPRKAAQGRAARPSGHRAPSVSRGPAYSAKSAPRTPR